MAGQEAAAVQGSARSVVRKVVVTVVVGALSFPITDMLFSSVPAQLAMAAGFGAVVLLVQFLIDFEVRLARVESGQVACVAEVRRTVAEGFSEVTEVTRLFAGVKKSDVDPDTVKRFVHSAAEIGNGLPPLAAAFATREIDRLSKMLTDLAKNGPTYEGEDQDWLLGLTGTATRSIDAISVSDVDAHGRTAAGFWESDLGRRFLELELKAVKERGVTARRVFAIDRAEVADDPRLRRICAAQTEAGITVRLLDLATAPRSIRWGLTDIILFDDVISYEVTAAKHVGAEESPAITQTSLMVRAAEVEKRVNRYRETWSVAVPWDSPELSA